MPHQFPRWGNFGGTQCWYGTLGVLRYPLHLINHVISCLTDPVIKYDVDVARGGGEELVVKRFIALKCVGGFRGVFIALKCVAPQVSEVLRFRDGEGDDGGERIAGAEIFIEIPFAAVGAVRDHDGHAGDIANEFCIGDPVDCVRPIGAVSLKEVLKGTKARRVEEGRRRERRRTET